MSYNLIAKPFTKWDRQSTTTPEIGSAFTTWQSANSDLFLNQVDTTQGNQYQFRAQSTSGGATAGALSATVGSANYRVRARIQLSAAYSATGNGSNRFRIWARATASGTGETGGYYFQVNDFIGSAPSIAVGAITDGDLITKTLATVDPGVVALDYLDMELEVLDHWVTAFLNERQVMRAYNTRWTSAAAGGFSVYPFQGGGNADTVTILMPFFSIEQYTTPFATPSTPSI